MPVRQMTSLPSRLKDEGHLKQLWYVPILAMAMALMLGRMLVVARLLPVEGFATYSLGLLISSSFCMLGCLGLQSLLQRDLPIMIVRRRERAGAVLSMQCVLVAVVSAFTLVIISLSFFPVILGTNSRISAIALIHGLSQQLFTIATVDSRSRNRPIIYANQNLIRAILLAFISPMAIGLGGDAFTALALEASCTLAVSCLLFYRNLNSIAFAAKDAMIVAYRSLRRVNWKSAVALLAISGITFVASNLDRWIAAQQLQDPSFGVYSFAWTIFIVAQAMQLIINASAYPLVARKYANDGAKSAFRFCARLSLSLLIASLFLSVFSYPIIVLIIEGFYSSYVNSLIIIPIFVIAACLRVSDFWTSYSIVTGREAQLLKATAITVLVVFIIWMVSLGIFEAGIDIFSISCLALMLAIGSYLTSILVAWAGACASQAVRVDA